MSEYVVKKWEYTNEDRYSFNDMAVSSSKIAFVGTKEDCIKWIKIKYLELSIRAIDLDDPVHYSFELDCDRLNYTYTYDSDAYYEYLSKTWLVTKKYSWE